MFVAKEKRNTNIAEYLLYMWQIEDLIRSQDFNIDRIDNNLVQQYQGTPEQIEEIRQWYHGLAESMLIEGIKKTGHLQFMITLMDDVNNLHFRLIDSSLYSKYQNLYMLSINNISELRKKMGNKEQISDVEVCLTALYGLLLMRLKKRTISEETENVFKGFSELLAELSRFYKKYEEGEIEL
jgi:hypothetical protein